MVVIDIPYGSRVATWKRDYFSDCYSNWIEYQKDGEGSVWYSEPTELSRLVKYDDERYNGIAQYVIYRDLQILSFPAICHCGDDFIDYEDYMCVECRACLSSS